jgi:hypothetical protein
MAEETIQTGQTWRAVLQGIRRETERKQQHMQVVLLRVGIDTGSGGIHGQLFCDRSFEYIPIPDCFGRKGVDKRTYGNTRGTAWRMLADYFPKNSPGKGF